MSFKNRENKKERHSSGDVIFTSSADQFDCFDKEIDTLASYGFTFSSMHMKDRHTKVVRFVRCTKREDALPEGFISKLGESYAFINN